MATEEIVKPFTPLHECTFSPHCPKHISKGANKENLFNNQELLK